jgi:HlyD family secretion protein
MWIGGTVTLLVIVGVLATPSVSRWSDADQSVSSTRLRFATVERGTFIRDVASQGRVVAAVSPTLFSPGLGTVTLMVQAGDEVTEGQVLATVDNPELASQLEQEHSRLAELEIEVERQSIQMRQQLLADQQRVDIALVEITAAERELRRAEASYSHQVISQQDYEEAVDNLATARLEHSHAEQDAQLSEESFDFEQRTQQLQLERQRLNVAEIQRQVDLHRITAPVSGVVGNLSVNQKDSVAPNQALMTVVDLSAYEVELQVPEAFADDLGIGMTADITIGTDHYPGMVSAVSPEVQAGQVSARVRFDDEARPTGLRQNQRVSTRIVLDQREDVLMVQRGPFFDSGAGRLAYVVGDGIAERRAINTGSTSLAAVEIIDGLEEGDTIVLSSLEQYRGAERLLITD